MAKKKSRVPRASATEPVLTPATGKKAGRGQRVGKRARREASQPVAKKKGGSAAAEASTRDPKAAVAKSVATNQSAEQVRKKTRSTATRRTKRRVAQDSTKGFPIVGVGASAGGLEAFTALLRALPANTGMAFVLVQHMDPTHESMLVSLLEKATAMPVRQVTEGMPVRPNHVYVIPPNTTMSIHRGGPHARGPHENRPRAYAH